ncbi:hypothetical protein VTH06DRAFT_1080 [Thermothelomyces fergusii]
MPSIPGTVKKPVLTHFLCIPLAATPAARAQLAASLSAFRNDVCAPPARGGFDVPEDAVRPVGTVHLTLGVMSFPTAPKGRDGGGGSGVEGLQRARELLAGLGLRSIWREVVRGRQGDAVRRLEGMARERGGVGAPVARKERREEQGEERLREKEEGVVVEEEERDEEEEERPRITLRGLASMQPADKAAVLYAPPVDPFGLLQAFCEKVRDVFREAGLMVDEGRPLLLHATVVNTVYVKGGRNERGGGGGKGGGGRKGGKKWERLVLDARGIIDRYEDQVWLENMPLEKVAICKMGAKKTMVDGVEDEAYEVEAEVNF